MTLAEAILQAAQKLAAKGITTARLDAEVLLAHAVNRDRVWIIAHGNDRLESREKTLFEERIDRRALREPVQYITGRQEFWGLEFRVTPDVLIPRPETEFVVEAALTHLKGGSERPAVIDLCTGSGCIAVSLAKEAGSARVFATDLSDRAIRIARENAGRHSVAERVRFFRGDLFQPLEELDLGGGVDLITANPPYIRADEFPGLQREVRDYEPEIALIAGPEGTEFHQRIIGGAPAFLKRNGALIMELGMGQAERLKEFIRETGAYSGPDVLRDLAGIERVIVARKR